MSRCRGQIMAKARNIPYTAADAPTNGHAGGDEEQPPGDSADEIQEQEVPAAELFLQSRTKKSPEHVEQDVKRPVMQEHIREKCPRLFR